MSYDPPSIKGYVASDGRIVVDGKEFGERITTNKDPTNCVSCKYFESFYMAYDCDEEEPDWCGFCHNSNSPYNKDKELAGCPGINAVCDLYEECSVLEAPR